MYLIMLQIWSDDLADLAENWARECIKGHSDKSLRKTKKFKKVGENIHRSTRMWLRYKLFMDLLKKSRIYLLNPRWLIRPHSFFFFFFFYCFRKSKVTSKTAISYQTSQLPFSQMTFIWQWKKTPTNWTGIFST